MNPDHPHHAARLERFGRIRRVKLFLRFMPRRAVFHKYPLIGRFAAIARQRSYLWSFKSASVRPALYAGSILSLLPLMGVQLPVAFVLAILLRSNVMLLGGLQFITNPATAIPVYGATYWLGKQVIDASGFGRGLDVVQEAHVFQPVDPSGNHAASAVDDPIIGHSSHLPGDPSADKPLPKSINFSKRVGTAINALVIGGVLGGVVLGFVLDQLWMIGVRRHAARHRPVHPPKKHSGSTRPHAPPK